MTDAFRLLSESIAARAAQAAPLAASIRIGHGGMRGGIVWGGAVVASEQSLPRQDAYAVTLADGSELRAVPAGRDGGTNIAALRLEGAADTRPPAQAPLPEAGSLVLVLGAGVRMAAVREAGPAWQSMAGGRIDAKLLLDLRFGRGEDGGPVVDPSGALLGMATAGPRGRGMVIPYATIARVLPVLLAQGRVSRPWLGVGLQPVAVPEALRAAAGQECGLMVVQLAEGGPAAAGGILPGDILLALDGQKLLRPRAVAGMLGAMQAGQAVPVALLRAGAAHTLTLVLGARPER